MGLLRVDGRGWKAEGLAAGKHVRAVIPARGAGVGRLAARGSLGDGEGDDRRPEALEAGVVGADPQKLRVGVPGEGVDLRAENRRPVRDVDLGFFQSFAANQPAWKRSSICINPRPWPWSPVPPGPGGERWSPPLLSRSHTAARRSRSTPYLVAAWAKSVRYGWRRLGM
jgi:hypothetical protein